MSQANVQTTGEGYSQKRREIKTAAKYRSRFALRVVLEFMRDLGGWVIVTTLALVGVIPIGPACFLNAWFAYLLYMPLHEAVHNNISASNRDLRFVDLVVGTLCAVPLLLGFRGHQLSHIQHHAYTNDPDKDPDCFAAGALSELPIKYAFVSLFQILLPIALIPGGVSFLGRLLARDSKDALSAKRLYAVRCQARFQLGCILTFAALAFAGYGWQALFLWYVPSRMGFFVVLVVFAWLPHHPHEEKGRYRDTRITLFPGSTTLIRGHDHHLLHHMFPRVPHYRLPSLFRDLRPALEENNARIQGSLSGPNPDPITLQWRREKSR